MQERFHFLDIETELAVWCLQTLSENNINELKGLEDLVANGDRCYQFSVDKNTEIWVQKVGKDAKNAEPLYQFVLIYKLSPKLSYKQYSTSFKYTLK